MSLIPFKKFHGCQNSFILIAEEQLNRTQSSWSKEQLADLARLLCDSGAGLGSDGVMIVSSPRPTSQATPSPTKEWQASVNMLNPDGSSMGMCGNGVRCVTHLLYHSQLLDPEVASLTLQVEERQVICHSHYDPSSPNQLEVTVNMGRPILDPEQIPINVAGSPLDQLQHLNQQLIHFSAVSMGNPHCVIFNSDLDPKEWGPKLEQWELFPKRTNVEFVSVVNSKEVAVTVWERGAGFTKACGTGACATVVAGALLGHCERQTKVQLPGGVLKIDWKKDSDEVFMTGPSQFVAVGEVQVP